MLQYPRSTILFLMACALPACNGGKDAANDTPGTPAGAVVTLYAAGAGAPTVLGTTTTGPNGGFGFGTYTCPSGDPPLYAVLTGGNGESTINSDMNTAAPDAVNGSIKLMAALGPCSKAPQNFFINELTTVAAVYALNAFRAVPGTTNANPLGDMSQLRNPNINYLGNGFATAAQLVDVTTGLPGSYLPTADYCAYWSANQNDTSGFNNCVALSTLTGLANALSTCVRSPAGSPACNQLYGDTNAANTLDAAMYVVRNPGLVNVQDIYKLSTQVVAAAGRSTLYTPGMDGAPNDWTLAVFYPVPGYIENGSGPSVGGIAIDADGHLWTGAGGTNYSFIEFDVTGNVLNFGGPQGLSGSVSWLTIDAKGSLWLADNTGTFSQPPSSVFAVGSNGLLLPSLPLGPQQGISRPQQLAADADGNIWVANYGNNSVSVVNTAQGEFANFTSFGSNHLNQPGPIAIDMQGNAWIGNSNGTLSAFTSTGAPLANPYSSGGLNGAPTAIAVDKFGNLWIAEESATSVLSSIYGQNVSVPAISYAGIKKLANNNGTLTPAADFYTMASSSTSFVDFIGAGRPAAPVTLAIDGEGTAWVLSSLWCASFNNCLSPTQGWVVAIDGKGNLLSPKAFFPSPSSYSSTYNITVSAAGFALDGAGNVWYVPNGSPGLFALIGAAASTPTPLSAQLQGSGATTSPSPPPPATYRVSVNVSGLPSATSVVLQDNGANNLTVTANGTYAFATKLANGAGYSVSVLTQPSGASCSASSPSGTIAAANVTVTVTCTAQAPATYTLGGSVTGLTGASSVTLTDGVDAIVVPASAPNFRFSTALAAGTAYTVSVSSVTSGYSCTVSNATGTMPASNVTNVLVQCTGSYALGGTITGYTGSGLVLENSITGGANQTYAVASGATTFTFPTLVAAGATYTVSVYAQPAGQTCSVVGSTGTGTMPANDVSTVAIQCVASSGSYTLGGSIFGLIDSGLVLSDNIDQISIAAGATSFTFPTPIAAGTSYTVIVYIQATGQTCTISNGSGTMPAANVTNVKVGCT